MWQGAGKLPLGNAANFLTLDLRRTEVLPSEGVERHHQVDARMEYEHPLSGNMRQIRLMFVGIAGPQRIAWDQKLVRVLESHRNRQIDQGLHSDPDRQEFSHGAVRHRGAVTMADQPHAFEADLPLPGLAIVFELLDTRVPVRVAVPRGPAEHVLVAFDHVIVRKHVRPKEVV